MERQTLKVRVALVDDQLLIREALESLVRGAEAIELVSSTSSGEEAVRSAEALRPDVALIDVTGAGFETVCEIRRRAPETKVVMLDDSPSDLHIRESLRVHAAGYLTKQQPFAQIEAALRQAAHGERVFVPEVARRLVLSAEGVRLPMAGTESRLASLTPREIDVLVQLAQGQTVKQCAKTLGIGASTVGNHKSRLMKKLGVHKTVELTRLAIREGLIPIGGQSHGHQERN